MKTINAQDLSTYQWSNRLLLIFTPNPENSVFKEQIQELQKNEEGLQERKLIIFKISPEAYKNGLKDDEEWKNSSKLYQELKRTNANFEVQLIGLDGGTKLTKTDLLSIEQLFSTIDVMPMRQAEMRKNRK
ncbi:DUF4174 domain-containing protein [Zunongwangia sp. H14]|uniref:DUF4174 domain-containing protein n=1 Tax=Zunongwangia sp. H14 TaxID=3240792 RepID=UPI003564255F